MSDTVAQGSSDSAGDEVAIIEVGGREWLRREFVSTANRLAQALNRSGLISGDAVGVLSPNCGEYLAIHHAVRGAGMYCVPVNWRLPIQEILRILKDAEVRALFIHAKLQAIAASISTAEVPTLRVLVEIGTDNTGGKASWDEFIEGIDDSPLTGDIVGQVMAFTSATTGVAKGVYRPLTPNSGNKYREGGSANARYRYRFSLPEDGIHLCCSQFYHGPVLSLAGRELDQRNVVVIPKVWNPVTALELIEKYRVTTTFMVPTMFIRLLKLPEATRLRYDVSSLKLVLHSGAPCPIDVKHAMIDWWGPILWERYGSVEGPVTLVNSEEWLRFPGTVGRPDEGVEIKILNDRHDELPAGEVGLVYIRPHPEFAFEYKGDPEKTRATRCGEYYTVGDIGFVNEDGYLFLCDRQADLIISGGVNIYAAEIEKAIVQHWAVSDCAVIGEPHELLGEVPRAIVQLLPGIDATPALAGEMLTDLREMLAIHQLPRRIEFVDELPRDPNGKLYKRRLRDDSLRHALPV